MATIAAPAPATQAFSLGSVLSGAWDLARNTFSQWVDSELGAEIALEQEAQASQAVQAAQQAPTGSAGPALSFNATTLALVGAAAVVVLLLLRR